MYVCIVAAMRKRKNTTPGIALGYARLNDLATKWRRRTGDTDLLRCISLISNMKSKVSPFSPRTVLDNARDKTYLARINTLMDEPVF